MKEQKYAGMIFSDNSRDLQVVENYLAKTKDLSTIWNAIDMRLAHKITGFSKWDMYPLTKELLRRRIKAYDDVDNGKYANPSFETERLCLKTFNRNVYLDFLKYIQYDETFKFFNMTQYTNEDFIFSLVNAINVYQLISKDKKERIGIIGVECHHNYWAINYYILPQYRRKGYAKEAFLCILENIKNYTIRDVKSTKYKDVYRKFSIGNKKIIEMCVKANKASCTFLNSLGFVNISENEEKVFYALPQ